MGLYFLGCDDGGKYARACRGVYFPDWDQKGIRLHTNLHLLGCKYEYDKGLWTKAMEDSPLAQLVITEVVEQGYGG